MNELKKLIWKILKKIITQTDKLGKTQSVATKGTGKFITGLKGIGSSY